MLAIFNSSFVIQKAGRLYTDKRRESSWPVTNEKPRQKLIGGANKTEQTIKVQQEQNQAPHRLPELGPQA
jgi:hypothetical protein